MRNTVVFRRIALGFVLGILILSSQACVGKFLSTMLSNDAANFKVIETTPVSNTQIVVSFNQPLNYDNGALVTANYSIPGLNIVSVTKGAETNQVYLNLDPNDSVRMQYQYYTLTVTGVENQMLFGLLSGAENNSRTFMGARWLRATCLDDTGAFTCPAANTNFAAPVTVTVRGDYAKGQAYRWALYNVTTSTYTNTQSAVTPIATTFNIPVPPTGSYRLELIIQDAAGAWQPATDTTYYYFSVDTTSVSDIGLSNTPAALTSGTVTNINIVYRNCVDIPGGFPTGYAPPCYSAAAPDATQIPASYKYRIGTKAGVVTTDCNGAAATYTFGAWQASTSTNIPINAIVATNQCYDIQVVAADNVGNYQCDTSVIGDGTAGACANPPGPGSGSITDFFATKTYQETRFLLDTVPPVAQFDTNTLPVNPTSATSFAITVLPTAVDSSTVVKYQYRVLGSGFSGAWSTDMNPGAAGDLISAAGLINGSYTIQVIGKDAAGNYQATASSTNYTYMVDTTAPTAALASNGTCTGGVGTTTAPDNGLPRNPTRFNCENIKVTGVTYYKYVIVSGLSCPIAVGSYSAQQTSATQTITNNNVAWVDGTTYSVCVIGSNDGALYQGTSASAVTRQSFRYDITPPSSMVSNWISPATNLAGKSTVLTDVNLQIGKAGAEDITAYKGLITTSACPTAAAMIASDATYPPTSPQSPLQATGLAVGTVNICFIARDAAGNYETTTNAVSYTVFNPPAPNDGGVGLDNFYGNSFNFTWVSGLAGIPTDTQQISVRVCKDAACSQPLPGMNNGTVVCSSAAICAVTSSYTLNASCGNLTCINQLNGSQYYAQFLIVDSVGVQSAFSASSDGKNIVGSIAGYVRDTNNNPVNGATVGIYQSDCTTQIGSNVTTPASGAFTFGLPGNVLPIALATNGYCVKAATVAPNRNGILNYIASSAGAATNAGNIFVVDTTGKGCFVGAVVDGSNGSQILLSNATFTLKDYSGATVTGTPNLDPDGKQFAFPASCVTSWGASPYTSPTYDWSGNGMSSGIYSLVIAIPSYYSITQNGIAVQNNTTTNIGYLPMVGTFTGGAKQIKVILTWGNQTKDLDLHVVGPSSNNFDCQPYNEAAIQNANGSNSKFHVYFEQRYCAETGTSPPAGSTSLAVDATNGYGPEIVNFYQGFVDGTYKISVYNNDPTALDWNVSGARIDVYAGNYFTGGGGLIKTTYNMASSTLRGWKPVRLIVSGTTLTVDDNSGSTFGYGSWLYGTGTFTCAGAAPFNINGPSDGLTAGVAVSGVAPADPNLDCGLYLNGTTAAGGAGPLDW